MSCVGGVGSRRGPRSPREGTGRRSRAGRRCAAAYDHRARGAARAMTYTPTASVSPEPAHQPPATAARPDPDRQQRVDRLRMFDSLSDRLRATLAGLTGRGRVTEADVDAAMREVRLALLEADVNFKVVKDFVARVRERAVGAEILESLTAGQQVVKIVHEELTALLSARRPHVPPRRQPGGRHARGPPGLGQDDLGREAREAPRQARPPADARRRGPLPSGGRGPARDPRQVARRRGPPRARRHPDGRHRPRRHRGREATGPRRRDHRHRRPPHHRRRPDGRDPRGQRRGQARRDAAGGRRDDRPGGRDGRPGLRRRRVRDRPRPDQDRRRRPRRRGALDRRGDRDPGQVPGHRREDRRPRGVLPGPARRPHPRHGRHRHARRSAPRRRSTRSRPPSSRSRSARARSRSRTCLRPCARCRRWARWARSCR